MSKIVILTPDKSKSKPLQDLFLYYLKMIKPHFSIEIIYTGATKSMDDNPDNIKKALLKESENIARKIKPTDQVVLLSEYGKQHSTPQLLTHFNQWVDSNKRLVFVLGSAYGLHECLYLSTRPSIGLSHLTFTHEMALVILTEQLYRLTTLRIGKRYHY